MQSVVDWRAASAPDKVINVPPMNSEVNFVEIISTARVLVVSIAEHPQLLLRIKLFNFHAADELKRRAAPRNHFLRTNETFHYRNTDSSAKPNIYNY